MVVDGTRAMGVVVALEFDYDEDNEEDIAGSINVIIELVCDEEIVKDKKEVHEELDDKKRRKMRAKVTTTTTPLTPTYDC